MTMSVRRELCAVMVFAVVERAGTIVLNDGEEVCDGLYKVCVCVCTPVFPSFIPMDSFDVFIPALLNLNGRRHL